MKLRKKFLVSVPILFVLLLFFFIPNNAALKGQRNPEINLDHVRNFIESKIIRDRDAIKSFLQAYFGEEPEDIDESKIKETYFYELVIEDSGITYSGWTGDKSLKKWIKKYKKPTQVRIEERAVIVEYKPWVDSKDPKDDIDFEVTVQFSLTMNSPETGFAGGTGTLRHRRTCWGH